MASIACESLSGTKMAPHLPWKPDLRWKDVVAHVQAKHIGASVFCGKKDVTCLEGRVPETEDLVFVMPEPMRRNGLWTPGGLKHIVDSGKVDILPTSMPTFWSVAHEGALVRFTLPPLRVCFDMGTSPLDETKIKLVVELPEDGRAASMQAFCRSIDSLVRQKRQTMLHARRMDAIPTVNTGRKSYPSTIRFRVDMEHKMHGTRLYSQSPSGAEWPAAMSDFRRGRSVRIEGRISCIYCNQHMVGASLMATKIVLLPWE